MSGATATTCCAAKPDLEQRQRLNSRDEGISLPSRNITLLIHYPPPAQNSSIYNDDVINNNNNSHLAEFRCRIPLSRVILRPASGRTISALCIRSFWTRGGTRIALDGLVLFPRLSNWQKRSDWNPASPSTSSRNSRFSTSVRRNKKTYNKCEPI